MVVFQAENDLGGIAARQPDSDGPLQYRLYEVAGTAHFDFYGLVQAAVDTGQRQSVAGWFHSMLHPTNQPHPQFTCNSPINTGPATFVARAVVSHLNRWIVDGTPPPTAERLQTTSVAPVVYAEDANGNVLGGVRTPAVDAPVAKLRGEGQSGVQFCFLFGTTTPFTHEELGALYGNHGGFVAAWNRATQDAVQAGFLVREDANHIRVVGAQSDILK